jgi:hypothetical protein
MSRSQSQSQSQRTAPSPHSQVTIRVPNPNSILVCNACISCSVFRRQTFIRIRIGASPTWHSRFCQANCTIWDTYVCMCTCTHPRYNVVWSQEDVPTMYILSSCIIIFWWESLLPGYGLLIAERNDAWCSPMQIRKRTTGTVLLCSAYRGPQ